MNDLVFFILFLITGFVTGVLAGLLGIGGGIVFIPALYIILPLIGCPTEHLTFIVIATSLFAGSFASGGAFFNHFKSKNISLEKGAYLAAGSIVMAVVIPYLLTDFDQNLIRYFICILLTLVLVNLLRKEKPKQIKKFMLPSWGLILAGVFIGTVAALTGTGGGILFFPVLFNFTGLDTRKAIGTSSMAVAITMIVATLSFAFTPYHEAGSYQFGLVNYFAGIPMGIAAVFGSMFGVKLNNKLPVFVIKRIFSLFLLLAVLKILFS